MTHCHHRYFELIANTYNYSYIMASKIYCPQNSSYSGPEETSCKIEATAPSVDAKYLSIYAPNGSPQDVIFEGVSSGEYSGSRLYCNDGYGDYSELSDGEYTFQVERSAMIHMP